MRPAVSRLQPRPSVLHVAVVGAMCALEITTAKPEDSWTLSCQATSFLPCRPFIQPAGGSGRGGGVGSGMVAHTREEDQQSIRGSSDQQPSWREERKRHRLFRTPRAPFAVAARWKTKVEKVVVPGQAVLPACICTMLNDKKSGGQRRMRAVEGKMPAFWLHAHQS